MEIVGLFHDLRTKEKVTPPPGLGRAALMELLGEGLESCPVACGPPPCAPDLGVPLAPRSWEEELLWAMENR